MKVFKDGMYYVEFEALARYGLPEWLELDKEKYEKGDYAIISDPRGIRYVKSRIDIIEYNDVKDLTIEELNRKIDRFAAKIEQSALRIAETPRSQRRLLLRDKEFLRDYNYSENIYYPLINYRDHKEEIDSKIEEITKSKKLVRMEK